MSGIVIVGAGEAGARAAIALRGAGFAGAVTLLGAERHAPYERPPLSKASIVADDEPPPPTIADAGDLPANGVDLRLGTNVVGIDRAAKRVNLADGESLAYDNLVLATGARARKLALPGGQFAHTLRSHEDAISLRDKFRLGGTLAVIGGGLIGLELAASARKLGCTVHVIEAAPRILTRGVPEVLARRIAARHEEAGVEIVAGAAPVEIREADGRYVVVLKDGRMVVADHLAAGIGAEPDLDLARAAGLALDNGVLVDANLRTSDPDIYAIGDCANFPHVLFGALRMRLESWRNAFDQGAHVAGVLMGSDAPYRAVPWFWSDQYDLTLQIAGAPMLGPHAVERPLGEGASLTFHLADDGRVVGASALGAMARIGKDMRLAEMLIAAQAHPDSAALADPATKLKALLPR